MKLLCYHEIVKAQVVELDSFRLTNAGISNIDQHATYRFDLETNSSDNLIDAVNKNSPVFVKSNGLSGLSSINIRGAASHHTKIFWNGINVSSPMLGVTDFNTLNSPILSNFEIMPGSGGHFNGLSGIGGNVILTTNNLSDYSFVQNFSTNTFGAISSSTKVARKINSKFFKVGTLVSRSPNSYSYFKDGITDTLKNVTPSSQNVLEFSFGDKTSSQTEYDLSFKTSDQSRTLPSPIGVSTNDYQDDEMHVISLNLKHNFEKSIFKLTMGGLSQSILYVNPLSKINSFANTKSAQINSEFHHYSNWFRSDFSLYSEYSSNKNYGYLDRKKQLHSRVTIGLRLIKYSKLSISVLNRIDVSENSIIPFIPSFSSLFFVTKNKKLSINLNASRNIQRPSLNDRYWSVGGNPDLNYEDSKEIETGLQYNSKSFEVGFVLYNRIIDNWILWAPNQLGIWTPQNLKAVQSKGIELKLNLEHKVKKLNISLNTISSINSSTNYEVVEGNENQIGKQLIYIPLINSKSNLAIKYGNAGFRYNYQFTDKRFYTTSNSLFLDSYHLHGASIIYHYKESMIAVSVNNIFNADFQEILNIPTPKINYSISITIKL